MNPFKSKLLREAEATVRAVDLIIDDAVKLKPPHGVMPHGRLDHVLVVMPREEFERYWEWLDGARAIEALIEETRPR